MSGRFLSVGIYALLAASGVMTLVTVMYYPGQSYVYLLFSVLLNAFLFLGIRHGSLFFDTFLAVFLWIGFWLKFSVRMVFADGRFRETVGSFDFTADAYDRALLVVSCGIGGLLAARVIRERFLFKSVTAITAVKTGALRAVYDEHRVLIWSGFVFMVLAVTLSNEQLGIYQRGSVPRTVLPYGLGGIYTWFLLFGASSISAVLLQFELRLRARVSYFLVLLVLLEPFLSNVSMLSRGMVLSATALLFGLYVCGRVYGVVWRVRTMAMAFATLLVLFAASIVLVNQLRSGFVDDRPAAGLSFDMFHAHKSNPVRPRDGISATESMGGNWSTLIMDRWVGMEGAMAVSSYPELGWDLWKEVWEESFSHRGTSFYDREISGSFYVQQDLSNLHFVSVPGILAFFFYPGSYAFLFIGMLFIGFLGAAIEAAVYRWGGGNLILCSLISFVVAYRYVHFGYAPGNSYALAGAIVLNIALIYLAGRIVAYRKDREEVIARAGSGTGRRSWRR